MILGILVENFAMLSSFATPSLSSYIFCEPYFRVRRVLVVRVDIDDTVQRNTKPRATVPESAYITSLQINMAACWGICSGPSRMPGKALKGGTE